MGTTLSAFKGNKSRKRNNSRIKVGNVEMVYWKTLPVSSFVKYIWQDMYIHILDVLDLTKQSVISETQS